MLTGLLQERSCSFQIAFESNPLTEQNSQLQARKTITTATASFEKGRNGGDRGVWILFGGAKLQLCLLSTAIEGVLCTTQLPQFRLKRCFPALGEMESGKRTNKGLSGIPEHALSDPKPALSACFHRFFQTLQRQSVSFERRSVRGVGFLCQPPVFGPLTWVGVTKDCIALKQKDSNAFVFGL